MDFLYKLYSYNYFGIGLFIVITILAFAFLVILFFGKKDEKTRRELEKVEENREAIKELERKQEEKKEELETISLENNPEITREDLVERIVENEKTVEEQVPSFTNTLEEYPTNEQTDTISTYAQDDLDIDFDKDIALQREEWNTELVKEENDTDIDIFNTQPTREYDLENEPISYEEVNRDVVEEPYDYTKQEVAREQLREEMYNVEPDTRENTRRAMPSVFSSVYKNNEREDIFPEETYQTDNFVANLEPETYELKQEEQIIEEPKTEPMRPITPKKPEFVMPKRADMPKLNKNNDNNDSIIKF